MLELDRTLKFDPDRAEEFFETLPAACAIVIVDPRPNFAGARPILLRTADLRRRMRLLLGEADPNSKRLNLRHYAGAIRFRVTGSHFEQALVHWQQARHLWPENYRDRLRLFPSPFIKLNLANPYPRAYITRRLGSAGLYWGPFVTRRAAEVFLEGCLSFFRIRRCQIKIRRDPSFPGCIYSEMKMCLAPCFAGCTPEEYADETARVLAFFNSRGNSLAEALAAERESASAALNYEQASLLHKRLEKVQESERALPELVRPLGELQALVVVRAAGKGTIALFQITGGEIGDPLTLEFGDFISRARSPEQTVREFLEHDSDPQVPRGPRSSTTFRDLEDQLALLARWFYGTKRDGEIFFYEPRPGGWPYRRILGACRRLLETSGQKSPT